MSLTYTTWTNQLANLMVQVSTDANFQTFLPGCIDYAEQRMYRDLDLLATRVVDNSGVCSAGARTASLPTATGTFLVAEDIVIFSIVGTFDGAVSTSNVSRGFLDATYLGASTPTGVPKFWTLRDSTTILFGPTPTSSFGFQVTGTQRPTPLSSTNTSTILTTMLPDAFMAASMVFASAYQRDWGAQSDDPAKGASWEAEYQKLIQSAGTEELRKKYQSQAWTSQIPNPIATPPRM